MEVAPELTLGELDAVCDSARGFSGRQMAKLMLNLQAAAFSQAGQGTPVVTVGMLKAVLDRERAKMANQREAAEGALTGRTALPLAAVAGEGAGAATPSAGSISANPGLAAPLTTRKTRSTSLEPLELAAAAEEAPKRGKTPSRAARKTGTE